MACCVQPPARVFRAYRRQRGFGGWLMRACTRQTEMFHGTQSFLPTSSSRSGYAACTWGKQSENAGSVMWLGLKSDAAGCCDGGVFRYLDSEMRACRVPESCRLDLRATNGQNMDCRPRLLMRAALRCLRWMDLSLRVECRSEVTGMVRMPAFRRVRGSCDALLSCVWRSHLLSSMPRKCVAMKEHLYYISCLYFLTLFYIAALGEMNHYWPK